MRLQEVRVSAIWIKSREMVVRESWLVGGAMLNNPFFPEHDRIRRIKMFYYKWSIQSIRLLSTSIPLYLLIIHILLISLHLLSSLNPLSHSITLPNSNSFSHLAHLLFLSIKLFSHCFYLVFTKYHHALR